MNYGDMRINQDITIKQVVLQKLKIGSTTKIPRHMIENATIQQATDWMTDEILYRLETYLTTHKWSDKTTQREEFITVPEDWLDALRIRFFPKLLTNKYPIKYKKIKILSGDIINNNYWIFPEIPPNPNKDVENFIMSFGNRSFWK